MCTWEEYSPAFLDDVMSQSDLTTIELANSEQLNQKKTNCTEQQSLNLLWNALWFPPIDTPTHPKQQFCLPIRCSKMLEFQLF